MRPSGLSFAPLSCFRLLLQVCVGRGLTQGCTLWLPCGIQPPLLAPPICLGVKGFVLWLPQVSGK